MKSKTEYIKILQSYSDVIRTRFDVSSLLLFGSVARGEHKEDSDIDVCVEMSPKLFLYVELGQYLEELLGCKVDVIRKHRNMSELLKKEIERDCIYVF